jgi:predicted ATP-grasp superfamily ATP-dependent carboligase
MSTNLTSFIAESLSLPGVPFSLAPNIINKYEFRKLCKSLDINTPNFFILNANERQTHLRNLKEDDLMCKFPVVVKNSMGCGKGKIFIKIIVIFVF